VLRRGLVFLDEIGRRVALLQYCCMVTKYDRRGYRPRRRPLVITSEAVYLLNDKDFRLNRKIMFANLTGLVASLRSLLFSISSTVCQSL